MSPATRLRAARTETDEPCLESAWRASVRLSHRGKRWIPHDGSSPTRIRRSCQGLVKRTSCAPAWSCWIVWRTISSRASPNLAKPMSGRLNFHSAARKFPQFKSSAEAFARFVRQEKLRDKRNRAISHKELPETWSERRYIHIPYRVLLQAIAIAVRLMKRIDRVFLGQLLRTCGGRLASDATYRRHLGRLHTCYCRIYDCRIVIGPRSSMPNCARVVERGYP